MNEKFGISQEFVTFANFVSRANKIEQKKPKVKKKKRCLRYEKWHLGDSRFVNAKCNTSKKVGYITCLFPSKNLERETEANCTIICKLKRTLKSEKKNVPVVNHMKMTI